MLFKRFFAFVIDAFLLGATTTLLSLIFRSVLLSLGENLWYIGFIIAAIYFIWFNSKNGKGQTIGMRVLKLKLVDQNKKVISIKQASIRYIVLSFVIFSSGMGQSVSSSVDSNNLIFLSIFSLIQFFIFYTIIIALVINKEHYGLHDYISNSYVIDTKQKDEDLLIKPIKQVFSEQKIRLIIFTIIFIILALGIVTLPYSMRSNIAANLNFQEMQNLKILLDDTEYISNTSIQTQLSNNLNNENASTKNLVISVAVNYDIYIDNDKSQKLFNDLKESITSNFQPINEYNNLIIVQRTGYNLGISNFYMSKQETFEFTKEIEND